MFAEALFGAMEQHAQVVPVDPVIGAHAVAVVPIANLLLLWFIALAEWPLSKARSVLSDE